MNRSHVALVLVAAAMAVPLCWLGARDTVVPAVDTGPPAFAPRGYVCYRAGSPPTIDGKLDDDAWAAVAWSDPFRDIEGDKQPEPRWPTRVKMLWDDQALYFAAQLDEPHVWATLTQHDSIIFKDNDFEVFLDPDGDSHAYAELELNALNTTWDLLLTKPYKDAGHAIDAWEITGLRTGVHIDGTLNNAGDIDRGWTLEIAWPLAGLRQLTHRDSIVPQHGDRWRINFSRVEWDVDVTAGNYVKIPKRPEHNWVWSPQGVIDMHRPEKWGLLQFSTEAPGATPLMADPAQPARDYLHAVYYAQMAHRKKHGRFVDSLHRLNVPCLHGELIAPGLETTSGLFEATVEMRRHGVRERWRITSDGRIARQ